MTDKINANGRIFAQFEQEMDEQYAQSTDLNGFSALPRPFVIRRMPDGSKRKYFTLCGAEPKLMTGLTSVVSIIKKLRGSYDFLADWKAEVGKDESEQIAQETSVLGTFMHILCAEITSVYQANNKNYYIEFDEQFKETFKKMMLENGVRHNLLSDYYKRTIKGAQSFYQFLYDWKVEVVAIEYCVCDFDNNISTPLDIVAYATAPLTAAAIKRGEKSEKFLGNFNIKFREKADSVYESDTIQTCIEQYMFNKYLPDMAPIERTFTITPKSHPLASVGCAVHEHTGRYTEDEYNEDLSFAKTKKANKDFFFPDLDKYTTRMGSMKITSLGIVSGVSDTIRDFILSHFKQ